MRSTGGKTEDFMAATKLLHKAGGEVKVPTYLVPATQKVRCVGRGDRIGEGQVGRRGGIWAHDWAGTSQDHGIGI